MTEPRDEDAASTEDGLDEEFEFEGEYDFEDWQDLPEEEASKILKGLEALIPDIVKRSLGSVLASEEGIRAIVGDKNIPKELGGFLLGQVDATRRGILGIISREVRVFLENMDFGGEIAKILTTLSFEVRTEIRFIPNNDRVKPSVKNSVRVRRRDDSESAEEASEAEDAAPRAPAEKSAEKSAPEASQEAPSKKPASRWTRRRRDD